MAETKTRFPYRKLTQDELLTEAKARFGDDVMAFAFTCPHCGDTASIQDFKDAGADPGHAGQECIGRSLGALQSPAGKWGKNVNGRGCDWVAYGLFHGPWEIVMPAEGDNPERSVWSFPLAEAVATP